MLQRYLAVAGVAAATLISLSPPAAASAQPLKLRGGLTLHLPSTWKVYRVSPDWIRVVTGKCAHPKGGYGTPECDGFWVLGPKAIKQGQELFNPYTGAQPFYPATDVQRCPANGKWGQSADSVKVKGLRQVGAGHKAAYREWKFVCRSYSGGKLKSRYTQREWFLPATKILVVDQWNTPGLSGVLKRAGWS